MSDRGPPPCQYDTCGRDAIAETAYTYCEDHRGIEGDTIDVCMTVEAENKVRETLRDTPIYVGATSAHAIPDAAFIDYPFLVEGADFDTHYERVAAEQPAYAVAPDIMPDDDPHERFAQAHQLAEHADTVIIVPKGVHPSEVPSEFRVGIPMQDGFGGGAPWSLWAYRDAGRVHLLGGSPTVQLTALAHVPVGSVDSNSILKAASFGNVWTGEGWTEHPELSYYERLERSYLTYHAQLNGYPPALDGGDADAEVTASDD